MNLIPHYGGFFAGHHRFLCYVLYKTWDLCMDKQDYKKLTLQQKFSLKKSREYLGSLTAAVGCLVYNCDTNSWNRDNFLGNDIEMSAIRMRRMRDVQNVLNNNPELTENYQVVATFIMPIKQQFYNGDANIVRMPQYYPLGTALVGNVLMRDKKSGDLMSLSSNWFGVGQYQSQQSAAMLSTVDFAHVIQNKTSECVQILTSHLR